MRSIHTICDTIKKHEKELKSLGAKDFAIFGSVAREENTAGSDIDILIDFDPKKGLFVFVDLKMYLESLLGVNVDLVSKKALHPALKNRILSEAKRVY